MAGLIDTRAIGNLETFDGRAECWLDWSCKARSWFSLLPVATADPGEVGTFLAAAEASAVPLDEPGMHLAAQAFSRVIYNVLVQVCQGKALSVICVYFYGTGEGL